MKNLTYQDILEAKKNLKGIIAETPTFHSPSLSDIFGANLYLKLENLQETGSFKERGAYTKLKSLSKEQLSQGVIAVSAGNHGQAVAFHAQKLGATATIVMPTHTPPTKVGNTEKWGAKVVLAGDTLNQSLEVAQTIMAENALTFIHPYDDPEIIKGQGTIGLEILEAAPHLEALIVPIGGGGLCSGIAIAAKHINPKIKIYGVEAEGYSSMAQALYGRKDAPREGVTLAEGIAVKSPGKLPQLILKDTLEDILIIQEEDVELAVEAFMRYQHVIVEGAGAAGLSALIRFPKLFEKKNVGTVVCGGNIDPRMISSILIRGQVRHGRLVYLQLSVQDIPGVLERVASIIAKHRGNVLEVRHQRLLHEIPLKMAQLDVVVETRGFDHIRSITQDLKAAGFSVEQLEHKLEKSRVF